MQASPLQLLECRPVALLRYESPKLLVATPIRLHVALPIYIYKIDIIPTGRCHCYSFLQGGQKTKSFELITPVYRFYGLNDLGLTGFQRFLQVHIGKLPLSAFDLILDQQQQPLLRDPLHILHPGTAGKLLVDYTLLTGLRSMSQRSRIIEPDLIGPVTIIGRRYIPFMIVLYIFGARPLDTGIVFYHV